MKWTQKEHDEFIKLMAYIVAAVEARRDKNFEQRLVWRLEALAFSNYVPRGRSCEVGMPTVAVDCSTSITMQVSWSTVSL